jgi:hypothetical protein
LGADFLFAYNENTNEVIVMKDDDRWGFDAAEKKVDFLNKNLYPGWSYKKKKDLEKMTGPGVKKPFLMHRWYMVEKEVPKIADLVASEISRKLAPVPAPEIRVITVPSP